MSQRIFAKLNPDDFEDSDVHTTTVKLPVKKWIKIVQKHGSLTKFINKQNI